jgi:hypothetical protein
LAAEWGTLEASVERETTMETAIIIRGKITDSRHIELDEPVQGMTGVVEVTLRAVAANAVAANAGAAAHDVFDLIATLAPGGRSKDEIDRQVADERDAWGDR